MSEETQENPIKPVEQPYKKQDFDSYILWKSLPSLLRDLSTTELEELGICDPQATVLLKIKTQKEFAEVFGLDESHLSKEWNKKIETEGLLDPTRKIWAKQLTSNVVWALYRTAVEKGRAAEVKLFLQVVEGWSEKTQLAVKSEGKAELSPVEIAQADAIMRMVGEEKTEEIAS